MIDGQIVDVGAGRAGADSHGEGIIVVTTWSPFQEEVYVTPQQVGPVKIASVDGMRFTLVPYDPWRLQTPEATLTPAPNIAFVFDLSTRQWVSSTPGTFSQATGTPIPTTTAETGYPPPRLAGTKEAAWTAVAEHDNELSTEVALHPIPTRTPGEPPIYPSATPKMGILQGCAMTTSPERYCYNAWRGVINGEIIEVRAGNEGAAGDRSRGLITVDNWHTDAYDVYYNPQRAGPVEIVAVDGMRITLAVAESPWTTATPGTTFVFDLDTRQWVTP